MGKGLESLIGLKRLKTMAQRDMAACQQTGEAFPHTLLSGPGGLGKSAFAQAIANDLDYHFEMIEGAMIKHRKQMLGRLVSASAVAAGKRKKLLLFIDEVHRLGVEPQEALYYPMVEFFIPESQTSIPPFSLFVATTHPHEILRPFRSRLKNEWSFHRYSQKDIESMVGRELSKHGLTIDLGVAELIAKRSLGVPRKAYNLAMRVRNQVLWRGGEKKVSREDCENTFKLEGIDEIGLDIDQISYLKLLSESQGQPKGVGGLAGALERDVEVVEDSIEPILLTLKFIERTSRGRVLTERGYLHLAQTGQLQVQETRVY